MKILHIVPGLGAGGGGVSECVPEACRALKALGHEVGIVICAESGMSKSAILAEEEGVKFHRLYGPSVWWNPTLFTWRMFRGLERIMRGYDVVHLNTDWLFPTWWGAHVARKLGKPYVLRPHGSFLPDRLVISPWKKRLAGSFFERSVVRHASAVLATCEEEMKAIRAYEPAAKALLVPYVIDLSGAERFQGSRVSGFQASKVGGNRTLLFFSRISYVKGLDLLAEAWGKIGVGVGDRRSDWKLVIVGPDDRGYTEEIKKVFAAKCPAGSYEFRGAAYGEEKWRLLAAADAFILPTRSENLGIVVAEAMACGLPVICTKGAPWSCLETEKIGWWPDVGVEGLEKALSELMALDDEGRRTLGQRARRWVEANLGQSVVAKQMLDVYERILRHG